MNITVKAFYYKHIWKRSRKFDKELIIVDSLIRCVTSEVWFKALIIFRIVFAHRTLWLDYDRGWLRIKMFSDCHVNCQSFFGKAFNWCFCQSEPILIGPVPKIALCTAIYRWHNVKTFWSKSGSSSFFDLSERFARHVCLWQCKQRVSKLVVKYDRTLIYFVLTYNLNIFFLAKHIVKVNRLKNLKWNQTKHVKICHNFT